jgi:hypothetical protein
VNCSEVAPVGTTKVCDRPDKTWASSCRVSVLPEAAALPWMVQVEGNAAATRSADECARRGCGDADWLRESGKTAEFPATTLEPWPDPPTIPPLRTVSMICTSSAEGSFLTDGDNVALIRSFGYWPLSRCSPSGASAAVKLGPTNNCEPATMPTCAMKPGMPELKPSRCPSSCSSTVSKSYLPAADESPDAWRALASILVPNSESSCGVGSTNQPTPAALGLRKMVPAVGKPSGPTAIMWASLSFPAGRSSKAPV